MSEVRRDTVPADLVALGRTAAVPVPAPDLEALVLARLAVLPPPAPAGVLARAVHTAGETIARRRRAVAAAAVAVLVGLLAAPPVRATVADWFGFHGVRVQRGAGPQASTAPLPPPATGGGLAEARRLVGFPVHVPAALGRPDAVEVTEDRRVVSMSWDGPDGRLRLDQFDGRLDYSILKTAVDAEFTTVGGELAVWFPSPHEVALLDADGTRRTESARLAGHTLIWERGGTTLRLEGDVALGRARQIAATATG